MPRRPHFHTVHTHVDTCPAYELAAGSRPRVVPSQSAGFGVVGPNRAAEGRSSTERRLPAVRLTGVHDHPAPDEAAARSDEVGGVGVEAVEGDAPQQRADDQSTAVRGQHAAELVAGLAGGEDAVEREGDAAGRDVEGALTLS